MHLTLRELLIVVTVIGIAISGLLAGPPVAWLGVAVTALIITGAAITAFVAQGPMRVSATGFLVPVAIYGAAVLAAGADEFGHNPSKASMPTSKLFQTMLLPHRVSSGGMTSEQVIERRAKAESVLPLGHLFTALILGYVGAQFAVYVHRVSERQMRVTVAKSDDEAR